MISIFSRTRALLLTCWGNFAIAQGNVQIFSRFREQDRDARVPYPQSNPEAP